METIKKNELIAKKKKLEAITLVLKSRFLGLDTIIDEVISLLMPWYLFPEAQLRPTVINLWGLTGSGKTALVQSIVELLDYNRFYTHLDMGEFESDSASWIKSIFTDDLEFFHQKPVLISLDEFQFARTLDANGEELGKDKLRVIWDLLDSGKIDYIPRSSTYYLFRADNCLKRLGTALKRGVTIQNGEVTAGLEDFLKIFDDFYFDDRDRYNEAISKSYFLSVDFMEGFTGLLDNADILKDDIKKRIKASSVEELMVFLLEGMHARPATRQLDLSRSLIFVLGNLDEAYKMSHNMNPDISADDFHEETSKITIATIKRALRKRFRPEQIARLGNNHIIYRSFSSGQFMNLIERELTLIAIFVQQQFNWTVTFDQSVAKVVYSEGVFPSQGTRPVFTTVKNLIESRISKMVVAVLEENVEVESIHWHYQSGHFVYAIKNQEGKVIKTIADETSLKLENLRKSIDPEIQAHTAVHEAGHAVLAALTLRIIPSMVVSRTASDAAEGFCLINFPKGPVTRETLKKDIIITLGGYVAEKIIFGEEYTCSGVYSDIEEASALANKAIRKYAMGSDPIHLAVEATQNEDAFFHSEAHHKEASHLVRLCEKEAEVIIERNKLLLLKMAEYLTSHSRMDENLIEEYVKKYSGEEWIKQIGFIKKEDYYKFNKTIQEQLKAFERSDRQITIEELYKTEVMEDVSVC
jgi:Peptidase family M41